MEDDYPIRFIFPCLKCEQIINIIRDRALKGEYTTRADLQEVFTHKRGNDGKRWSINTHLKDLEDLGYITISNLISGVEYGENHRIRLGWVDAKQKGISLNAFALYLQMIENEPSLMWEWLERQDLVEFSWGLSTKVSYKCKSCYARSFFKVEDDVCPTCGHQRGTIFSYKCPNCGFSYVLKRPTASLSNEFKKKM